MKFVKISIKKCKKITINLYNEGRNNGVLKGYEKDN